MESEKGSKNIIRPLNSAETEKFLQDYKEIFYKSSQSCDQNLREKVDNLSHIQNRIDPECIVEIKKHLVRVEYPGLVQNVDKAIETLGGIANLETKVAEQNSKLELRFHPRNHYNRSCVASRNFKPGLLLKVLRNPTEDEIQYQIVGNSAVNFEFDRLCDFQYLPLVAPHPETKDSPTNNIYRAMLPARIPDADWFTKTTEDAQQMASFLPPERYSSQDSSGNKCFQEDVDVVKEVPPTQLRKKVSKIFGKNRKQTSIFVTFKEKDIPERPLPEAVKLLRQKGMEEKLERVKQLFKERPIWTKAAIRYNTGLTDEQLKTVLPVVAYHASNGPWRVCWVKFGYDPRRDPKARIYQTLDYRIRVAESTSLKVNAKRSHVSKTQLFRRPSEAVKKVTLREKMNDRPRVELDERCYVLRSGTTPPARQMYYQLCDVIIPEIQELLSKLAKVAHCDSKNGWLPDGLIERLRKIVNDHVLDAVQAELLKERKEDDMREYQPSPRKPLDYCNQMLDSVKKSLFGGEERTRRLEDIDDVNIESICLSSDEDDMTVGEIIQRELPETMELDTEIESEDEDDGEIDMEALEDIKQLVSQANN